LYPIECLKRGARRRRRDVEKDWSHSLAVSLNAEHLAALDAIEWSIGGAV